MLPIAMTAQTRDPNCKQFIVILTSYLNMVCHVRAIFECSHHTPFPHALMNSSSKLRCAGAVVPDFNDLEVQRIQLLC